MQIQVHTQQDLHVYQQKKINPPSLSFGLAKTEHDVEEAQRLRRRVFSEEYGAQFLDQASDLDEDQYDKWCDHL